MSDSKPGRIVSVEIEVKSRLDDFGLSKADFEKICEAMLHGRNLSSALQPKTAEGLLKYIFGVEGVREVALASVQNQYEVFSKNNIEGVFDAKNGRKIMFQMVDKACNKFDPQPKSKIGEGKKDLIKKSNQVFLFPEMEAEENKKIEQLNALERAEGWYAMISIDLAGSVNCEISRPKAVVGDIFSGFHERIWVFKDGEFVGGDDGASDNDDIFDIKPKITKK